MGIVVVVRIVPHVEERLDEPRGEAVIAPAQRRGGVVFDGDVIAPWVTSEQF